MVYFLLMKNLISSYTTYTILFIVLSGGAYPIRSHAFKIVPPAVSETINMPNSCQNGACHDDKTLEWAKEAFKTHYPDYNGNK